jgi:Tfp pilus assembly protein PilF
MAELQRKIGNDKAAEKFYRKAIKLNPVRSTYLQNYGLFLGMQGKHNWADSLMQAGVRHDISNPERKRKYAEYLIESDENEKGLQVMAAVFAQDPRAAENDIAFLVNSGISESDIRRNLPNRVVPFLKFAALMEQRGDLEQAAALYHQALTYINNEENLWPKYFIQICSFFSKHKRYDEGLDVILQAIKLFPAHAGLRVRAGNLYWDMGLIHQADEQYQQALAIDQENFQVQKHLSKRQRAVDKKFEM